MKLLEKRASVPLAIASVVVALGGSTAGAAVSPEARFGDTADSGGYVVTPRSMTGVSSTWVVPRVTCSTRNAAVSLAVGLIDDVHGGFTRLGVDVDCHGGAPTYGSYIRLPGGHRASVLSPVAPGDEIYASLRTTDGDISASMCGAGWCAIISTDGVLHPTSAGILVTRVRTPSGDSRPLADFGTVHFSHTRLNGSTITGRAQRLTMRQDNGERAVKVSPLTRPAGSFSVSWLHI